MTLGGLHLELRRPAWQVLLASLFANAAVVAFALHADQETWLLFWALFLAFELPSAASREPGDTMSECWWLWLGFAVGSIPARPARRAFRSASVVVFGLVLVPHLAFHWPGGGAVAVASLWMTGVIAHSYLENRKKESREMGDLMAKLLKPLLVKFLKGNWGKLLPMLFKTAGEGGFGETVKKIYWWSAGKKTITGAVILGLGTAMETVCSSYAQFPWSCEVARWCFIVGGFLISVGLADGGTRSPWPQPPTALVEVEKLPEVVQAKYAAADLLAKIVEITPAKQTFYHPPEPPYTPPKTPKA